jgi:hypothetical protein
MKIALISYWPDNDGGNGEWCLTSNEEGVGPVFVGSYYVIKHSPQVGSYYVRYENGYESCSPAKAFEDGYTLWLENTP